jgi:glutamate-1-semialdehyde 2,1-aminomutase
MRSHQDLFNIAKKHLPGGVNSPVRALANLSLAPLFFERGQGPMLYDYQNNAYVDYVGGFGPCILGHAHPGVMTALQKQSAKLLCAGACHDLEARLAAIISEHIPSMAMMRMLSSGTEASMTAIRLARAATGRAKIIKFRGCYHGHVDALLLESGSGALSHGQPSSAGIPASVTEDTLLAEFNDLHSLQQCFKQYPNEIAAVIVEPVAGNMGCILPQPQFLPGIRKLCDQQQSLLIFDEIMTGFRLPSWSAQNYYHVRPDLTLLGKIIGGGLPMAAIGGSKELLSELAPLGPVYQAGTLSGNPLALATGLATLQTLTTMDSQALWKHCSTLCQHIDHIAAENQWPLITQHIGAMFGINYGLKQAASNYTEAQQQDQNVFKQCYLSLLKQGILLAPSPYESGFVSSQHNQETLNLTINALQKTRLTHPALC